MQSIHISLQSVYEKITKKNVVFITENLQRMVYFIDATTMYLHMEVIF